jgi:O-acetyl-ADP-ribose deacetylase (regulator of RNase III)
VGPLVPDSALRIVAQALVGLQKAHEAHVVHRDLKPANLFLARSRDGAITVKLLDFGIAKIEVDPLGPPSHTTGLTIAGGLIGSPLYMSPEQVQNSSDVDHRTDIWSLGITLYSALAGRAPHQHIASIGQLLVAVCISPPAPLCDVAPWVPPEVAKVVHGALELGREARYESAAAMLEALRSLLPSGDALREEMLAPVSDRTHAALSSTAAPSSPPAPRRIVVDERATPPVRGDETTQRPGLVEPRITVDPRRFLGADRELWTFPFDAQELLFSFLARVYHALRDAGAKIPPLTYGRAWVLFDPRAQRTINKGTTIEEHGALRLGDAGIEPETELWVMSPEPIPRGEVGHASPRHRADTPPIGPMMKRYTIGEGEVILTLGDITRESTDAIVIVTDGQLSGRGGVDRAIHIAAGPELLAACQVLRETLPGRQLATGEAIATPGFRLQARHVIHCVGPIYHHDPVAAPDNLGGCFRSALRICRELELRSIAFPAISTGTLGYPMNEAAIVSLSVIQRELTAHPVPALVRIVLVDSAALQIFAAVADSTF